MSVLDLKSLKAALPRGTCVLGLDLGSKTIGLAVSDPMLMIASPIDTIRRKKFTLDLEKLKSVISDRGVGALVLGLPVSMDGTEGPRCQSTRQFAKNVLEHIDIPIAYWDERLSTSAIQRLLIDEADMTRQRRAEVVDKMAASYILQGALDLMVRSD
jgi:putative Holliday junction resolvase